ncbi:hypothetical protein Taro_022985 [Colocasia esculenta]|uniref:GDSL esterase/lipase EXL3 n=1 Tax=Colocasia esculenta TaxID=4460 RepID=A0A843V9I4_COLES|nr:hypothetical protein [Colocasia esculenta]
MEPVAVSRASPFAATTMFLLLLLHIRHLLPAYALNTNITIPKVPAVIVFGDSIMDPGNNNRLKTVVKCDFPPYGKDFVSHRPTGRFCNGKIPTDFVVSTLGIKELMPAYLDPNLTPQDLLTGVSFASGGSGFDPLTPNIVSVLSLADQMEMFKDYKRKVRTLVGDMRAASIVANSLYAVCAGSDDVANTYFTTPFRKSHYDIPSYVKLMVTSATSFIQELYNEGARKIGVLGVPPIGCVPSQRTLHGGILRDCSAPLNEAALLFNKEISTELERLAPKLKGSRLIYVDIYAPLLDIMQYPLKYGFLVSTQGCCGTGNLEVAVLCNPLTSITCPDASKYVFWDSYHPTEAAYKILIDVIAEKYLPILTG